MPESDTNRENGYVQVCAGGPWFEEESLVILTKRQDRGTAQSTAFADDYMERNDAPHPWTTSSDDYKTDKEPGRRGWHIRVESDTIDIEEYYPSPNDSIEIDYAEPGMWVLFTNCVECDDKMGVVVDRVRADSGDLKAYVVAVADSTDEYDTVHVPPTCVRREYDASRSLVRDLLTDKLQVNPE